MAAALPDVVALRRRRDHALGRPAALDQPERAAFFRSVLLDLAGQGALELTLARVEGALAAYVVGLRDGAWLRLWDGRVDPDWDDWSLGRIVDLHVLEQALADPARSGVDWMRGEEDYKGRMASRVVPAEHLVAASSPLVARVADAPGRWADRGRQALHASPAALALWRSAKRRVLSR